MRKNRLLWLAVAAGALSCSTPKTGEADDMNVNDRMTALVKVLAHTDSATAEAAMDLFFNEIGSADTTLARVAELADKYLNNPESHAKNEGLFIRFAQRLLNADSLPEAARERTAEKLRLAKLNRPGSIAADFAFADARGNKHRLHEIKARKLLLVFYNPECTHCTEILANLAANKRLNAEIAAGQTVVTAIYAEGKHDVWQKSLPEMPGNWMVGYDLDGVMANDLYDLPAMPYAFVLDSAKRVIVKDPVLK